MATNNAANNATAASGTVLQGAGVGTASTYSTATYPATTTINQILYSSAANTVTGLATANSAILATNSSGVPSITTAAGYYLNTARCCFSAYSSSAVTNQTGDGTAYTIVFGTKLFDQGTNFDGTSTFTAPVTGKYLFTWSILSQNNGTTHNPNCQLVTTANTFTFGNFGGSFAGNFLLTGSVIAPMTANDTAVIKISTSGSTKTVGVYGAASDPRTTFSGFLLC
jgi:hypothetical protein